MFSYLNFNCTEETVALVFLDTLVTVRFFSSVFIRERSHSNALRSPALLQLLDFFLNLSLNCFVHRVCQNSQKNKSISPALKLKYLALEKREAKQPISHLYSILCS